MSAFLIYEQKSAVVTLTMNAPEQRNVLTGNTAVEEIVAACARINADPAVRAVILTGAGTVFSAGGHIGEMQRQASDAVTAEEVREEYRRGIQRIPLALYNLEVPAIAAVNGPAIGAGCDLACMCDIRIASDKASFAESFVRLGIIPGDGGAWLLPRIVGVSRAAEMSFTGRSVTAAEALQIGLVTRVVPGSELMGAACELANEIAANPGGAVRMSKRLLREGASQSLSDHLEIAAGYQALAHKSSEHAAAVAAFLAKRPPKS